MSNPEFLKIVDLMKRYGVSRATINNWCRRGIIPSGIKIAQTRRWSVHELEAWENERIASERIKAHE